MIERMHGTSFDWLLWSAGAIIDLGIACRFDDIIQKQRIIKQYAIGYCEGDKTICRPKQNTFAVMFLKDGKQFWTHLTKREFEIVFLNRRRNEN